MIRYRTSRIAAEDLARDRSFWSALLDLRCQLNVLPPHTGAGYGNRRFPIIRNAAWITLYRAIDPSPHIGVFLRCSGPAGEALFTLADRRRSEIEPSLVTKLGPGAKLRWGGFEHPSLADAKCIITTTIAAPFPWDDAAAGLQIAWLLRIGAVWWDVFSRIVDKYADDGAGQ